NEQTTTVGKTRIAHVSVYRKGDTLSRFSLDVPLSSQVMSAYVRNENYSGNNKQDEHEETIIPGQISMYYDGKRIHTYFKDENGKKIEVDNMAIHTIMAYLGKLEDIPDGWHLCDGTNGTNDLRGLFIRGFGSYTFTQDHGANGGTFAREHVSAGTVGDVQGDATYWIRSSTDAFFLALGGATGYTLGWLNSPTWFGSRIGYQQFRFTSGGYWGLSNTNHQGSPASSAYVGHYYFIPYAGFGHYKYRLRSSGGGMSADGKTAYPPTYSLEEYYEPASTSEGFTEMGSAFQIASDTQLAAPVDVNHNEIRPINKTVYFIEKIGTN
ncbi:MAG: hypothetical protein IKN43_01695, partial [Selenomonadaceae bacterium]|nr:hypothetical protein [Selenomonadaceae bacterium]